MKIAITGHTAGIGQALAKVLHEHEIVGLSKRDGNDIKDVATIADAIEPCDIFINNAQDGYAQTDLLFEMAKRWTNSGKSIIVISTQMALQPTGSSPDMDEYRVQKVALEEAVHQLRSRNLGIKFVIVRPGNIATSPDKKAPLAANVDNWARTLDGVFQLADANDMFIQDISLGPASPWMPE